MFPNFHKLHKVRAEFSADKKNNFMTFFRWFVGIESSLSIHFRVRESKKDFLRKSSSRSLEKNEQESSRRPT